MTQVKITTREDFKVEIVNKEQVGEIFKLWGEYGCICYATPQKFAEKVGQSCLTTGHFSGSRSQYIIFKIENCPRSLVDQMVRHEVGVVKNVQSQRYTDSSNLGVYYPQDVLDDEAIIKSWNELQENIKATYDVTVELLKEKGYTNEQAREVARGIIPMNVDSSLVIGFTIEALINFCHKRMCKCSQEHIRHLAMLMRRETVALLPQLNEYLVPVCVDKLYCPESEKRSCGMFPQKSVVQELVKKSRVDFMK